MIVAGPANTALVEAASSLRIVTVRRAEGAWVAAVAVAVCDWRDVPGEFSSEAEAVHSAVRLLREVVAS